MTSESSDLLAPLDLAFWSIESAAHPMHLGALGVFTADSPSAAAHAADLLAARAPAVPGLRMRIRPVLLPPGGAERRPAPGFDPLDHVHLAPPAADFHAVAGALMERPLDRDRPPWEAHVLPAADGASFAVLFKFHHALADGLRALTLAAGVMDPVELPPVREPRPVPATPWWHALDPRRLPGTVGTALSGARTAAADVGRALDIGASVARATWGVRSCDALTSRATGTRSTTGVELDLDDVHRVRKTVGGTVNDVLIAVVAGALRRWLDERGDGSEGVAPRALVPVSRRRPRTAHPQGNRLSGYLVRLPVDDPDPLARLRAVRTAMDRNKDAGPTRGAGAVALLADHVPSLGHRVGGPAVAHAARLLFDILVTSVPLPSLGLRLGGCPLTEVYPFAPLARGQALAVAVSTYRGRVHYGLVADAAAVPDLDLLARCVRAELAVLVGACESTRGVAGDRSGLVPGARAT
ncbi:wax ester/triacylglycerol synthase family O-acyltransferase [Streptomyces flavofungini]|uniref:Diacylglycerol O-acyltransferase n=1 Tax=Streptomyces flavofungini TaxID=68200 RepID=A0ABS0XI09_9ACTN|nr:wax ester/triacylglycerol synthase family O-acyltransferase [Streptomyces flavofungini]MBJ3812539.1 wax ester/triacylglycerol synthase family O-acyltransferase [Streptomyces flavofungini]GHC88907.1 diacylglycerol O-acyltransferase [Streptomyces flavofungini]